MLFHELRIAGGVSEELRLMARNERTLSPEDFRSPPIEYSVHSGGTQAYSHTASSDSPANLHLGEDRAEEGCKKCAAS